MKSAQLEEIQQAQAKTKKRKRRSGQAGLVDRVSNGVRLGQQASGQGQSVSQGHDQHQAVGVVRGEDMRSLPLPTIALEVTETGFLPETEGIQMARARRSQPARSGGRWRAANRPS